MKRPFACYLTLILMALSPCLKAGIWDNPEVERGGWKYIAWYGWIADAGNGWVYHLEHGWTYAVGDSPESIWFYDQEFGWAWSGEGTYPNIFQEGSGDWFGYLRQSMRPRQFIHYATSDWMLLHGGSRAMVKLFKDTYDWRHREYIETEEHQLITGTRNIVTTRFETPVIENDLIRVTLLPDWGARILSIYYKPFNCELLSYTRAGNFSEIIQTSGAFYYDDWLLLPGGINPTFPEGEHGKYWGLPWDFSIIEESAEYVTVRMSRVDDIDWPGHPEKFDNGLTGMVADMDVTVYRDRACVEISYTLTNTRNAVIPYEFWMAASLAPSTPDVQFVGENLEIVMNQEKLLLRDYWNWMKQTETDDENAGDDVYMFDKLAWLQNWRGSGIAYAYPLRTDPWWGVINHDNQWGVLRTADEPDGSPGMKLWGTGSAYGMFELWSGNSQEFFTDAFMDPLEVKTWKEYFIPTIGLSDVRTANSHGAVDATANMGPLTGSVDLSVFSTWQPANWRLQIHAVPDNGDPVLLGDTILNFSPQQPTESVQVAFPMEALPSGPFHIEATVTDLFTGAQRIRCDVGF